MIDTPLPLDFQQTRVSRKEKRAIYEAVRVLRKAGHVVYRQGGQHSFDGKIASDRQLVELAEALRAGAST